MAREANVAAHERAHHQEGTAHVEPAVAAVRVGQLVVGLAARLVHGEEVGEHLCGVPLGSEPVVDGHAGVLGEHFDIFLTAAAVLDGVVHAAEDARGVGDRLLVPELRARRIEICHVRALVERGHLEGGARAGRRLLEDQRDLLPGQTRCLGVLRTARS